MFPIGKRFGLSVFAMTLMMLGALAMPVNAAYINVISESADQGFTADPNGHTYLYVDPNEDVWNREYLVQDEDALYTRYSYTSGGWDRAFGSCDGPATRTFSFEPSNTVNRGWLDNSSRLPRFFDFANTTGDPLTLGAHEERVTFPLSVGTPSAIVMEPGQTHYGTFNITDEEYIHLTIASRMDSGDIYGFVIDTLDRYLCEFWINNGKHC